MAAVPMFALAPALPEIVLAASALLLVLIGALRGERAAGLIEALTFVALLVAGFLVVTQGGERLETFGGSFVVDAFARFAKVMTLVGSAAALLMSGDFLRRAGINRFEYPILILLATVGMMMMISAGDLIALYLGLELQSLALYVVAAIDRDNARSSGMLLYGASLIYGFTGTVSFAGIAQALQGEGHAGAIFGLVFIAAGLAFKISAVPFHMWTPDVYEGAPTPVAAFFAAAPKMAAMALLVRVFITAFPGIVDQWRQIIVFVAIASMALGSFAAIGQRNIKRLMAYSSIGHMGYALVGLAAGTAEGVQSVLVYMAIYLVMTLGTFAFILSMRREEGPVEGIDDLAGLARTQPYAAYGLTILFFSLAGIPPLAGFLAKWYVFAAAVEAKLYTLAVIGVLASVIGAYYYIRVVKIMHFDDPAGAAFTPMSAGQKVVFALASIVILILMLPGAPAPLNGAALAAARSLF
jgi:NADH-quinone oxidoreductase subunit N